VLAGMKSRLFCLTTLPYFAYRGGYYDTDAYDGNGTGPLDAIAHLKPRLNAHALTQGNRNESIRLLLMAATARIPGSRRRWPVSCGLGCCVERRPSLWC